MPIDFDSTETPDLWPATLDPVPEKAPATILKEQASALARKTQWKLRGSVETAVGRHGFTHTFQIIVPALQDYTYDLFVVSHGLEFYPVKVADGGSTKELKTEAEFLDWLGGQFRSQQTLHVIGSLLRQVA